jgi:hypothetical protein
MISVQIEGAKELENKLLQLETKVGRKIVRSALRKAQKSLIPTIKGYLSTISKGGGTAQRIVAALTVRAAKKNPRGSYAINVQLKPDVELFRISKDGKRSFIPAAIEYGHGHDKEGAARPYMRPAADSTEKSRVSQFTREVAAGIAKIWTKK